MSAPYAVGQRVTDTEDSACAAVKPVPSPDAAPQSSERPARGGETCTCGRPATIVYQTPTFGDVPYCGIPGGRHSAPQGPPDCPDWCEIQDHEDDELSSHRKTLINWHSSDASAATGMIVRVRQRRFEDPATPYISLWGYHDPHPVSSTDSHRLSLDAGQARMLAAIVAPDEVAAALREAADELDRIGGGS